MRFKLFFLSIGLMMLLAACGGNAAPAGDWLNLELVDARTGETFKLSDFAGKTVYVEPMATWCINCRRQMKTIIEVLPQIDPEKVVFVGLSVAENVDNQTLANYVDEQGFTWLFAVATPELGRALIDRYGQSAVIPPTTPHIIIYPDGTTSELITGYHDVPGVLALVGES
jgi:thiol-disulfide isomerase/thioredoxin